MKRRTFGGVDGRGLGGNREENAGGGGGKGNNKVTATVMDGVRMRAEREVG